MNTKIIIGVASAILLVLAAVALHSAISNARVARLETAVEKSSTAADEAARTAADREKEAAAFKEKIGYLETALAGMRTQAAKQDEQLEKITAAGRGARVDYNRARRTRSVTATPAELCEKLAALGHPCE